MRLGATAAAAHSDDVNVFFENVLELEVELGFCTFGNRPEIMLGGLEHLASPRLGTRHGVKVAITREPTNSKRYTGSPPLETAHKRACSSRSRQPTCQTRYNPTPSKPRLSRLFRLTPQTTAVFFTTSMGVPAIHHALCTRLASSFPAQRLSSQPTARDDATPTRDGLHSWLQQQRARSPPVLAESHAATQTCDRTRRCRHTGRLPRAGRGGQAGPATRDTRAQAIHYSLSRGPFERFGLARQALAPLTSGIRRKFVRRLMSCAHLQNPGPFARMRVFLRQSPCWGSAPRHVPNSQQ